MKYIYTKYISL